MVAEVLREESGVMSEATRRPNPFSARTFTTGVNTVQGHGFKNTEAKKWTKMHAPSHSVIYEKSSLKLFTQFRKK